MSVCASYARCAHQVGLPRLISARHLIVEDSRALVRVHPAVHVAWAALLVNGHDLYDRGACMQREPVDHAARETTKPVGRTRSCGM